MYLLTSSGAHALLGGALLGLVTPPPVVPLPCGRKTNRVGWEPVNA